jgi:cation transport regulator ChaC
MGGGALTDRSADREYVFGYGSLLGDRIEGRERVARICCLHGYRRVWDVAMDNALDLPGYKHYCDRADGSRPAVFVTFLNLAKAPGHSVNGVVFPVDASELASLDDRERNYVRREVTESLGEPTDGCVWAYVGAPEAETRFREGLSSDRAVVSKGYLQGVHDAFRVAGGEALEAFEASTDPPACPVMDLRRIDHD